MHNAEVRGTHVPEVNGNRTERWKHQGWASISGMVTRSVSLGTRILSSRSFTSGESCTYIKSIKITMWTEVLALTRQRTLLYYVSPCVCL